MDPISLLLLGATIFGGAVVADWIVLSVQEFYSWFTARRRWLASGDYVAGSVQEALRDGRYRTVQGIFNSYTDEMIDSRVIYSDDVDPEIRRLHRANTITYFD